MSQSATLPTHECPTAEKYAPQAAAPLLTQSREDCRLAERVEHALRATGYRPLCAIEVAVNARIVHLLGHVPSDYLKQVAQVTALAIPGAHQIHNDLDVGPSN